MLHGHRPRVLWAYLSHMEKDASLGLPSLPPPFRAAVVGATGAIGAALAEGVEGGGGEVLRFGRSLPGAGRIDLRDEASIAAAAAGARDLRLLLITTGGLAIGGRRPEKALSHLDPAALADQFAVNAIGPALVLKHFERSLARKGRVLIGVLSARVGSISDNRLGGWYGYRAAKAALNQVVRTASIEMARKRPELVIAALHPGTVESPLSAPFRPAGAADPNILTPAASAARLLRVLDGLSPVESGTFWDHAGARVDW